MHSLAGRRCASGRRRENIDRLHYAEVGDVAASQNQCQIRGAAGHQAACARAPAAGDALQHRDAASSGRPAQRAATRGPHAVQPHQDHAAVARHQSGAQGAHHHHTAATDATGLRTHQLQHHNTVSEEKTESLIPNVAKHCESLQLRLVVTSIHC